MQKALLLNLIILAGLAFGGRKVVQKIQQHHTFYPKEDDTWDKLTTSYRCTEDHAKGPRNTILEISLEDISRLRALFKSSNAPQSKKGDERLLKKLKMHLLTSFMHSASDTSLQNLTSCFSIEDPLLYKKMQLFAQITKKEDFPVNTDCLLKKYFAGYNLQEILQKLHYRHDQKIHIVIRLNKDSSPKERATY